MRSCTSWYRILHWWSCFHYFTVHVGPENCSINALSGLLSAFVIHLPKTIADAIWQEIGLYPLTHLLQTCVSLSGWGAQWSQLRSTETVVLQAWARAADPMAHVTDEHGGTGRFLQGKAGSLCRVSSSIHIQLGRTAVLLRMMARGPGQCRLYTLHKIC